jgi:hypothetical protein
LVTYKKTPKKHRMVVQGLTRRGGGPFFSSPSLSCLSAPLPMASFTQWQTVLDEQSFLPLPHFFCVFFLLSRPCSLSICLSLRCLSAFSLAPRRSRGVSRSESAKQEKENEEREKKTSHLALALNRIVSQHGVQRPSRPAGGSTAGTPPSLVRRLGATLQNVPCWRAAVRLSPRRRARTVWPFFAPREGIVIACPVFGAASAFGWRRATTLPGASRAPVDAEPALQRGRRVGGRERVREGATAQRASEMVPHGVVEREGTAV